MVLYYSWGLSGGLQVNEKIRLMVQNRQLIG
jgi:hypothetical protein